LDFEVDFMILEQYIKKLQQDGKITTISKSISKNLEIAGVLKSLEPQPVLFENVKESEFRVAGNLFCNKMQISDYFGITTEQIIPTLAKAIEERSKPEETDKAPCQEVVENYVDLDKIPILMHNKVDGGPYISSGVVVAADPEFGQNRSCDEFTRPFQNLGPHTAPLGCEFYSGNMFPEEYRNTIFIAEHGSWNRREKIGYRISMVSYDEEFNSEGYSLFATGWLDEVEDEVWGRPVDLEWMPDGSLLISDDFANAIYRVTYSAN